MTELSDLSGRRFGRLVVQSLARRPDGRTAWACVCDCGTTKLAKGADLIRGRYTSCGCARGKRKDMVGQRFGRLTVVAYAERGADRAARWVCRCDCGQEVIAHGNRLRSGKTTSCGCARSVHGGDGTREYHVWVAMRQRCYDPNHDSYEYYGGRGIEVCNRWLIGEDGYHPYQCFMQDMGPRPSDQHSIDRINNDGHYERGNCRWATSDVQNLNRRRWSRRRRPK